MSDSLLQGYMDRVKQQEIEIERLEAELARVTKLGGKMASAYNLAKIELDEAWRLLQMADDLYTNYGLVASPTYGDPGTWINLTRKFLTRKVSQ
jgi:hypothetical protein